MRRLILTVLVLLLVLPAYSQTTREAEKITVSDTAGAPTDGDECDPRRVIIWFDQEAGEHFYCHHSDEEWQKVPAGSALAAGTTYDVQSRGSGGALDANTTFTHNPSTGEINTKILNETKYAHMYATGGSGTEGDPWTGWDTAISLSDGDIVKFAKGYFKLSSQWYLEDIDDLSIIGGGIHDTVIVCDMTGAAKDELCTWIEPVTGVSSDITIENIKWHVSGQFDSSDVALRIGSNDCKGGPDHGDNCQLDSHCTDTTEVLDSRCVGDVCQCYTPHAVYLHMQNVGFDGADGKYAGATALKINNVNQGTVQDLRIDGAMGSQDSWGLGVEVFKDERANRGNINFDGGSIKKIDICFEQGAGATVITNTITYSATKCVQGTAKYRTPGTIGWDIYSGHDQTNFMGVQAEGFETGIKINGTRGRTAVIGSWLSQFAGGICTDDDPITECTDLGDPSPECNGTACVLVDGAGVHVTSGADNIVMINTHCSQGECSDTADATGTHDGGTHATVLTDSGESWDVDAFVGWVVVNETDVSWGTVTSNTATTVTVSALAYGTDNQWESGDTFTIIGNCGTCLRTDGGSDGIVYLSNQPREIETYGTLIDLGTSKRAYELEGECVGYRDPYDCCLGTDQWDCDATVYSVLASSIYQQMTTSINGDLDVRGNMFATNWLEIERTNGPTSLILHQRLSGTATSADATGVVLTDSGRNFVTNDYLGKVITNTTDGSDCIGTSNTATTITCTAGLSGGTDDQWEIGDGYSLERKEKARFRVTTDGSQIEITDGLASMLTIDRRLGDIDAAGSITMDDYLIIDRPAPSAPAVRLLQDGTHVGSIENRKVCIGDLTEDCTADSPDCDSYGGSCRNFNLLPVTASYINVAGFSQTLARIETNTEVDGTFSVSGAASIGTNATIENGGVIIDRHAVDPYIQFTDAGVEIGQIRGETGTDSISIASGTTPAIDFYPVSGNIVTAGTVETTDSFKLITGSNKHTIDAAGDTGNYTSTFPDETGTVIQTSSLDVVNAAMLGDTPVDEYCPSYEADTPSVWDWVACQGGGGGSGTMTTVEEGDVGVGGADIVTLDFDADDFDITESPDTEINIVSAMDTLAKLDTQIGTTGTPDATTFLRGDNAWSSANMTTSQASAPTCNLGDTWIESDASYLVWKGVPDSTGACRWWVDYEANGYLQEGWGMGDYMPYNWRNDGNLSAGYSSPRLRALVYVTAAAGADAFLTHGASTTTTDAHADPDGIIAMKFSATTYWTTDDDWRTFFGTLSTTTSQDFTTVDEGIYVMCAPNDVDDPNGDSTAGTGTDLEWWAVTQDGDTDAGNDLTTATNTTYTATGMSCDASNGDWYEIKIEKDPDNSEVRFYWDNVLKATHTTNIPGGRQFTNGAVIIEYTDTNTAYLYVSYIEIVRDGLAIGE